MIKSIENKLESQSKNGNTKKPLCKRVARIFHPKRADPSLKTLLKTSNQDRQKFRDNQSLRQMAM